MKLQLLAAIGAASILATAAPATAADRPNATAVFSSHKVAFGASYTWGHGVLTFHGRHYPFKINGLGVVGVGIAKINGVAKVYHLKSAADFAGTYAKADAGGSLGESGGEDATLSNDNGVVMNVHARERGVQLNLGGGGVHIKMTRR